MVTAIEISCNGMGFTPPIACIKGRSKGLECLGQDVPSAAKFSLYMPPCNQKRVVLDRTTSGNCSPSNLFIRTVRTGSWACGSDVACQAAFKSGRIITPTEYSSFGPGNIRLSTGSISPARLVARGVHGGERGVAGGFYEDEDFEESLELTFIQRLAKAWRILFPPKVPPQSAAEIGRERLRLVLYTDRGEVSPEIRRRLRTNIIDAIKTYVEIESEEEVRLSVSADPDLGTVYAITVPVRRVRPEYQEVWSDAGFRDRFYEEMIRENGGGSRPSRMKLETKILGEEEGGDSK